jgi:pyruvate-ferredoxin/flavodoxin oxidoreductase
MTHETEELNAELTTAQVFSRLLPDTPQKFLGLYNDGRRRELREAALRNHLMVRRNYEALVSARRRVRRLRREEHPARGRECD